MFAGYPIRPPLKPPVTPPRHRGGQLPIADEGEVMREQLEYLIQHAAPLCAVCQCATCERFRRVREALTEIFK